MAVPTTRSEFKEYCLRKLGKPVIEINVDDDQVEDRIDESLRYYWDYHFDGAEKTYYRHLITAQTKSNKYITLPENITGAVRVFPIGQSLNTMNLFNIRYQIALNDLYQFYRQSMVPFYMNMQHIQFLEQILVGQQPIRYTRHRDRLYIDMDWDRIDVGKYVVVEAYEVIDPDTYADVWKDRWLLRYATALIKRQWGSNLKKFGNILMPGGVMLNGKEIYDEAVEEIKGIEEEMFNFNSLPSEIFTG